MVQTTDFKKANVTNFQRRKTTEPPKAGRRVRQTDFEIQALAWQEAINWEKLRQMRFKYEEAQINADIADLMVEVAGNNYMTTELKVTESELNYQLQEVVNQGRQLALDTAKDQLQLQEWERDLKWLAGVARLQGISLSIDQMSFDNTNKMQVLDAHGAPISQRQFMTGEKMERGRITSSDIKGLLFAPVKPALSEGQQDEIS
jgi:hypothetical protein